MRARAQWAASFGTTSVQLRERKNGFLAPKRHQMKHLDFLISLFGTRRSVVQIHSPRPLFFKPIKQLRQLPVPGELLILGDFGHFAIHGSRSARRSRSVHSDVAESVLGENPRYPATRSFEAGDIKPGSGRHQAAAGV